MKNEKRTLADVAAAVLHQIHIKRAEALAKQYGQERGIILDHVRPEHIALAVEAFQQVAQYQRWRMFTSLLDEMDHLSGFTEHEGTIPPEVATQVLAILERVKKATEGGLPCHKPFGPLWEVDLEITADPTNLAGLDHLKQRVDQHWEKERQRAEDLLNTQLATGRYVCSYHDGRWRVRFDPMETELSVAGVPDDNHPPPDPPPPPTASERTPGASQPVEPPVPPGAGESPGTIGGVGQRARPRRRGAAGAGRKD